MTGPIYPPLTRVMDERFAPVGPQGTMRQAWGHSLALSNEQFPVALADHSDLVGFVVYGGEVKLTNFVVTDWDGNVLLTEDFSGYEDGVAPDDDWSQETGVGGGFIVATDLTAPSASHKVLHRPNNTDIWSYLFTKAGVVPADNRFIIDVDVLAVSGTYCFMGPAWYVTDKEAGIEAYYYCEEKSSAKNYFRSVKAGVAPVELRNRSNEGALPVGTWQHMRVAVDDANCKAWSTYRGSTILAPRDYNVQSNKCVIFDTRRDDVAGPGSLEQIFITEDGLYVQQTIDIYVDGEATARVSMPIREFLGSGLLANTSYFTRYQGALVPLNGQIVFGNWRSVHIPYSTSLRIELSSNDPSSEAQKCWVGVYYRRGKVAHAYPVYSPQRKTTTADPMDWVTIYETPAGQDVQGRLHYVYMEMEATDAGYMDGSMRIWIDGEIAWQSDAGEDTFLHCFYGTRTGIICGDQAGMPYKNDDAGVKRAFYRMFLDPIFFSKSLKVEFQNGQDCGVTVPTTTWRSFCEVYTKKEVSP